MVSSLSQKRNVSNHEPFYQDSSDEGDTIEQDCLSGRIATLVFGASVGIALHNENREGMSLLSRIGGCSRFQSSGYICLESSDNFIGI